MDEETERELIRRLSEKPESGGREIPPPDLLAKIVAEIPNPLPDVGTRKSWYQPRAQSLRFAAMLLLFVGAGFLATRIIPDLNPKNSERTEPARGDRSTVTQPAAPGAAPEAPGTKLGRPMEKAKAAPPATRSQPFADSTGRVREAPAVTVDDGVAGKSAGTDAETDRLDRDAKSAEVKTEKPEPRKAVSRDEERSAPDARQQSASAGYGSPADSPARRNSPAVAVPAPAPVAAPAQVQQSRRREAQNASAAAQPGAAVQTTGEDVAPLRVAQVPRPQSAMKDASEGALPDERREKKAVATGAGPAATGSLSAAPRSRAKAANEGAPGRDSTSLQKLVVPLAREGAKENDSGGRLAALRRALDAGRFDALELRVDDFIALSPSGANGRGGADRGIRVEGAPSPDGRGPRILNVLFELPSDGGNEPMEARVDVDSALVASDLLVGKSVAGVPGEPVRLLYRLELRRAPGDAERILTLEVLSRGGGVATAVLSGRNVAKRWEDASAEFRLVSLSALVAERLLGLPAVRDVDAALLTRRLEEISRVRSNDADVRRLVRAVKEDRGAGRFAPEVEPKR